MANCLFCFVNKSRYLKNNELKYVKLKINGTCMETYYWLINF